MDVLFLTLANSNNPNGPEAIGWVMLALAACAVVAEKLFVIADRVRGKKPHAADLQTFASRGELDRVSKRVTKLEATLASELTSINRSLGRIEGAMGTKK